MAQNFKPINLRNVLLKYLYHWPLFILGLMITIGLGYFYLRIAKPNYEIRATILVKDAKKTTEEKSALQELERSERAKIAENEVEIISSRKLVSKVVDELQLWIDYTTKECFVENNLYQKSPVRFIYNPTDKDFTSFSLNVRIEKDGFTIIEKDKNNKTKPYNSLIQSKFGAFKITSTSYKEKYLNKEISISVVNPTIAAENYQNRLQVSLLNKLAPTISLSINDKVTKRGKEFLNTLITNYILSSTSEKNENSNTSINFIDKKLDSLRGELNSAEGAVENFKSGNGLTDISSESKVYLENVRENDAKRNDVDIQINIINGIENYINSPQNSNTIPSTIGITDSNLSALLDRLSQLQLQKSKLLATTPEGNYIFEPINSQIRTTKAAIASNVKSIKTSLLTTKRGLEKFNSKFQNSIRQIPGQERQSVSLNRQQKAKEDLYNYLLQKRAELSLSYTATLSDARIIDSAYVGPKIWPQTAPILALSGFLGLLLPFALIYGRNSIKDKVLTKEDIEKVTVTPLIGELPNENSHKKSIIDHSVNNVISEHFRALRTKLYYVDKGLETGRVILVTSSVSGEGKSFVSANLSTSLSFMGRKVILLELDLRKPKLSQKFNLPIEKIGLTEYLSSQEINADQIIQKSNSYNLDIISAGQEVNNPAELLTDIKLNNLISYLKKNYDDIIIDSPPLHLVTDAMIISRIADITLYIIRQGITDKSELDFINEIDKQNEMPNLKIVFNGVKQGKFGYGNHYNNSYYTANRFSIKKSLGKFFSRF